MSLSGQRLGRKAEYARLMVRSASVNGRPRTAPETRGRDALLRRGQKQGLDLLPVVLLARLVDAELDVI